MHYTATVTVVVPQLVHCVHCDCKFVYEMEVTGSGCDETGLFKGRADARESAASRAREHLGRKLNKPMLCDVIPCPLCFRYQPYMREPAARERFSDWGGFVTVLGVLTVAVVCVAAIMGVQYPDTRLVGAACAGGTVFVWLAVRGVEKLHRRWSDRYNPDEQPLVEREKQARRAVLLAEYEREKAREAGREYLEHVESVRNPKWAGKAFEKPEPLVIDWWFSPSVLLNGGSTSIKLPGDRRVTIYVPEDSMPGEIVDAHLSAADMIPFQVRVLAMRVHPDEQRLE